MQRRIEKGVVLGAGTMGARISAHRPQRRCSLLPARYRGARRRRSGTQSHGSSAGLDGAVKSKPAAFFKPSLARLGIFGNFEDDTQKLASELWGIIEAVVEDMETKRISAAQERSDRKPGTIITTNTSGLPVGKIVEGFSEDSPAQLVWHALLQASLVHATAGTDSHAAIRN